MVITKDAHVKLMDMSKYRSQIFTCSALKICSRTSPVKKRLLESIGSVKFISGVTPKAGINMIHIVEPILNISGSPINLDLALLFVCQTMVEFFTSTIDSKTGDCTNNSFR